MWRDNGTCKNAPAKALKYYPQRNTCGTNPPDMRRPSQHKHRWWSPFQTLSGVKGRRRYQINFATQKYVRNPNSSMSFATAFKHTKTGNDGRGRLSSLAFGFATKDFPQNPPRVRGWQTCWPTDTHMAAPSSSTWISYQLLKRDTEHVNTKMSSVILTCGRDVTERILPSSTLTGGVTQNIPRLHHLENKM